MNATRIMRYRDSSKMDPVIAERCVKMALSDAFGGFQYSRTLPTPFAFARRGLPCHFSAVAASSESTIRTRNTAVTENSARIGGGFIGRLVICLSGLGRKLCFRGAEGGFELVYPQT